MTELNKTIKQLDDLTQLGKPSEEEKKKLQDAVTDLAQQIVNGQSLTSEQFKIVMDAFNVHKENIIPTLKSMHDGIGSQFLSKLSDLQKKFAQEKQHQLDAKTQHPSGKNNLKTIFNSLDRKMKKTTDLGSGDKKEIENQLIALNKEMSDRNLDVSFLNAQQKKTLQQIYQKHPEIVDNAFQQIPDEQKSAGFIRTYNEMSGKDIPVPEDEEKQALQDYMAVVNDFANYLKEAQQKLAEQENQQQQQAKEDDNTVLNARTKFFKKEFPTFTDEQIQEIVACEQQARETVKKNPELNFSDEFTTLVLKSESFNTEGNEEKNEAAKERFFTYTLGMEEKEIASRIEEILGKEPSKLSQGDIAFINSALKLPNAKTSELSQKLDAYNEFQKQAPTNDKTDTKADDKAMDLKTVLSKPVSDLSVEEVAFLLERQGKEAKDYNRDIEEKLTMVSKEKLEEAKKYNEQKASQTKGLDDKQIQEPEPEITPTPEPEITLKDGEKQKLLDSIDTETWTSYMASIDPRISTTAIEAALALDCNINPKEYIDGMQTVDANLPEEKRLFPKLKKELGITTPDEQLSDEEMTKIVERHLNSQFASMSEDKKKEFLAAADVLQLKPNENNEFSLSQYEQILDLYNRNTALTSLDDAFVAYDHVLNKGSDKDIEKIENVIKLQLEGFNKDNITPENAYVIYQLAHNVYGPDAKVSSPEEAQKNSERYEAITDNIALALKKYDLEHFGNLGDRELEENFKIIQKDLNNKDVIAHYQDYIKNNYKFVDDETGLKEVKEKDKKECYKSIVDAARALSVPVLAKAQLSQDAAERRKQIDAVMQNSINQILEGRKTVSKNFVIAKCAHAMNSCDTYNKRVDQKFPKSTFGKKIKGFFKKIDKSLTKRFGNKYLMCKKFGKMARKIVPSAIKTAALFAVAGSLGAAAPVATAALITYFTGKQLVGAAKKLSDPSLSKAEKIALIGSTAITAGLSAVAACAGLGGLAGTESAFIQAMGNISTSLGFVGRTALSTVAMSIPNGVKGWVLRRKHKKLKAQIAEEKDPKRLKELIAQEKALNLQKVQNRDELIGKAIGTAAGMTAGMAINHAVQSLVNHQEPQPEASAHNEPNQTNAPAQPETIKELADGTKINSDGSIEFKDGTIVTSNDTVMRDGKPVLDMDSAKYIEQANAIETQLVAEDPSKAHIFNQDKPFVADAKPTDAQNLQEAQSTRVHPSGHSVHDMTNNSLSQTNDLTGLKNTGEIAQNMSEGYGDKAYMATKAALAEPAHVTAEIKASMSPEDFSKLGLSDHPTSAQLINCMQQNPSLADNAGLNKYFEAHFDSAQRFTPSDTPAPVQHHVAQRVEPIAPSNTNDGVPHSSGGGGVRYNTMEEALAAQLQSVQQQPAQQQPEVVAHQPVYNLSDPTQHAQAYLAEHPGSRIDVRLTNLLPPYSDYDFIVINEHGQYNAIADYDKPWVSDKHYTTFSNIQHELVNRNGPYGEGESHCRSVHGRGFTTHYVPTNTNVVVQEQTGFDKFIEAAIKANIVLDATDHTLNNMDRVLHGAEHLGNTVKNFGRHHR